MEKRIALNLVWKGISSLRARESGALGGARTHDLSLRRAALYPTELQAPGNLNEMVPKERFELSCPYGHYALNVARLPFRHFGAVLITGKCQLYLV
jgi:hypothetical protein